MMKLVNNLEIPDIGLGVYKISEKEMNEVISLAYQDGYKLFDTAQMYKNETALGEALKKNKILREDIFLISKVDNCNQGYDNTIASFYDSLKKTKNTIFRFFFNSLAWFK